MCINKNEIKKENLIKVEPPSFDIKIEPTVIVESDGTKITMEDLNKIWRNTDGRKNKDKRS